MTLSPRLLAAGQESLRELGAKRNLYLGRPPPGQGFSMVSLCNWVLFHSSGSPRTWALGTSVAKDFPRPALSASLCRHRPMWKSCSEIPPARCTRQGEGRLYPHVFAYSTTVYNTT